MRLVFSISGSRGSIACTPVSYTHLDVYKRQVYARTREECEEKLKVLIVEMKEEIEEAKRLMNEGKGNGSPSEEKKGKRGKKGRK